MTVRLTENPCVCSGRTGDDVLFECADLNFGVVAETGQMLACRTCGSWRPDRFPTLETIGQAYQAYYTTADGGADDRPAGTGLRRALLGDYPMRGLPADADSVLDFGCGSGAYLRTVLATRPEVRAYGTDVLKSDQFPTQGPVWIDPADLPTLPPVAHVALGHVLEHLHDPITVLRDIAARLRPGGTIWIATPNARSVLLRGFTRWARDVDFPRHRLLFSAEQITHTLAEAGFVDVRITAAPRINALLNFRQCLRNLMHDPAISRAARMGQALAAATRFVSWLPLPARLRTAADSELIVRAVRP